MHLGRNVSYECLVNQSVLHQVKMKLVMVYLKENNREIKFHLKKGTEKVVLLQGLIEIIVKFRAENFFTRIYHAPNILLRGTKHCG